MMEHVAPSRAVRLPVHRLSTALQELHKSIQRRASLGSIAGNDVDALSADEAVCLTARHSFTRFLDTLALSGVPDEDSGKRLQELLYEAVEVLSRSDYAHASNPYLNSVREKLSLVQGINTGTREQLASILMEESLD